MEQHMHDRSRYELKRFGLKTALIALVFCSFFLLLSIHNPQILRLSRTAGVTMLTYIILLPVLLSVYHGFEIDQKDATHIVNTTTVSIWLTDVITYFHLLIMNVNDANRSAIAPLPGEIVCLIAAMLIQLGLTLLFSRLGEALYLKYNPTLRSCLICPSETEARCIREKLKSASRYYRIERTLYPHRDNLKREILQYDQVFLYNLPLHERQMLVEYCYKLSKPVSYSMEISDIIGYGAAHDMFGDVSFVSAVNRRSLTMEQRFVKRTLDVSLSLILLIALSPVMLLCAAAIKLQDRGSILFRQARATVGGRVFMILKFRTMREDADNSLSVQADDDRITPVGRFLRRFRLDELPQLINILRGDMSLVGPRPEMISNVISYTEEIPEFSYRLAVKAGLTGYAQIAGRYNTAPKEKMMLDLMYIENYSIWRDVKLLLQTVMVLFRKDSTEGFLSEDAQDQTGGRRESM